VTWNAKPPEPYSLDGQVRRDHDFPYHLHCLHRARTSTRTRSRGITKSPSSVWTICFLSYDRLSKVLASGPTCGMSPCRRLVDALHVHEKSSSRHHAHLLLHEHALCRSLPASHISLILRPVHTVPLYILFIPHCLLAVSLTTASSFRCIYYTHSPALCFVIGSARVESQSHSLWPHHSLSAHCSFLWQSPHYSLWLLQATPTVIYNTLTHIAAKPSWHGKIRV